MENEWILDHSGSWRHDRISAYGTSDSLYFLWTSLSKETQVASAQTCLLELPWSLRTITLENNSVTFVSSKHLLLVCCIKLIIFEVQLRKTFNYVFSLPLAMSIFTCIITEDRFWIKADSYNKLKCLSKGFPFEETDKFKEHAHDSDMDISWSEIPSKPFLPEEWNPCYQEARSWTAGTMWGNTFSYLQIRDKLVSNFQCNTSLVLVSLLSRNHVPDFLRFDLNILDMSTIKIVSWSLR